MSAFRGARLAALSAAAIALMSSYAFAAHCQNLVCAEGRDDGRTLNVYLTSQMSGATHFNVRTGGRQFESTGRFSLNVRPHRRYTYAVQVCKRGGVFQKSVCGQWFNLHHDVKG